MHKLSSSHVYLKKKKDTALQWIFKYSLKKWDDAYGTTVMFYQGEKAPSTALPPEWFFAALPDLAQCVVEYLVRRLTFSMFHKTIQGEKECLKFNL